MDTDPLLRDQLRYLELRLAECRARPELHRHQIAAYEHQIELARRSPTALAYLEAMERTGTTLEIVRAEWLDRYGNWSCIYRALGNEERQRAAELNVAAARAAHSPHDFAVALSAAKLKSGALQQGIDTSLSALPGLLIALVDWATEADASAREELQGTVAALWAVMRANDPACTWQRICRYSPYRQRIPFDDTRMQTIGSWLRQAVGAEACDRPAGEPRARESARRQDQAASPTGSAPDRSASDRSASGSTASGGAASGSTAARVPTAQEAARAYHLAHDALDRGDPALDSTRRVYQRIFELEAAAGSGPTFLRLMAEEGIYVQLAREPQIAVAQKGLSHCRDLSQPHLEHHYRALLDALHRSRSPTEVEYELERLGEYAAAESAWNDVFLRYAVKAITAAASLQADPGEARRQTAAASYRVVCNLFGRDWDAMFQTSRVWDFFCKVMFTRGQQIAPTDVTSPGTQLGEIGFPAVQGVREATIWRAMERLQQADTAVDDPVAQLAGAPQFTAPEDMKAYLTELLHRALAGSHTATPGDAAPALLLWGQRVPLDDLLDALGNPPRPEVELISSL